MMHKVYFFSACLFCLSMAISCKGKKDTEFSKVDLNQSVDSSLASQISKFSLPYQSSFLVDSNSLIFCGNKTFDTSFLLILQKRTLDVAGTYYEVLPEYHRSLNDLKTQENKILIFNGYGFSMTTSKWHFVMTSARNIPVSDLSEERNPRVLDGDSYTVCFNRSIKKSNPYNVNKFEDFFRILQDSILRDIRRLRVPIMQKR